MVRASYYEETSVTFNVYLVLHCLLTGNCMAWQSCSCLYSLCNAFCTITASGTKQKPFCMLPKSNYSKIIHRPSTITKWLFPVLIAAFGQQFISLVVIVFNKLIGFCFGLDSFI